MPAMAGESCNQQCQQPCNRSSSQFPLKFLILVLVLFVATVLTEVQPLALPCRDPSALCAPPPPAWRPPT